MEEKTECLFDAEQMIIRCIKEIKSHVEAYAPDVKVVIEISGDRGAIVMAALCCEALGNNRVIGVLTPNGRQDDPHLDLAARVCEYLDIRHTCIDLEDTIHTFSNELGFALNKAPAQDAMDKLIACLRATAVVTTAKMLEGVAILSVSSLMPLSHHQITLVAHGLRLPDELIQ